MANPEPRAETAIVDAAQRRRYELTIDGKLAGILEYRDIGGRRALLHTEVLPAFEGRGLGGKLARHALEEARARGGRVTVKCPFVLSWLERHPEYHDVVTGPGGAHGTGGAAAGA